VESSANANWRAAVAEAWRIAESVSAQLRDAKPGGEVAA
jgi:hypothetical protein